MVQNGHLTAANQRFCSMVSKQGMHRVCPAKRLVRDSMVISPHLPQHRLASMHAVRFKGEAEEISCVYPAACVQGRADGWP